MTQETPLVVLDCRHVRVVPNAVMLGSEITCFLCDDVRMVISNTNQASLTEVGLEHLI